MAYKAFKETSEKDLNAVCELIKEAYAEINASDDDYSPDMQMAKAYYVTKDKVAAKSKGNKKFVSRSLLDYIADDDFEYQKFFKGFCESNQSDLLSLALEPSAEG